MMPYYKWMAISKVCISRRVIFCFSFWKLNGKACIPGSLETETERQFLVDYHPHGTARTADWNTLPSFWERGLFACPGTSARGAAFWLGTHLETTEVLSGNRMPSLHSPSASQQLSGIFQKGAYTLIWSTDLCTCCLGNTPRSPSSSGQQGLCLRSHWSHCISLHASKAAA